MEDETVALLEEVVAGEANGGRGYVESTENLRLKLFESRYYRGVGDADVASVVKQLSVRGVNVDVPVPTAYQTRVENQVNVPDCYAFRAGHHLRPNGKRKQLFIRSRNQQRFKPTFDTGAGSEIEHFRQVGRKESVSKAVRRDSVRVRARAFRDAVQHGLPVFGTHRNDELVEVLDDEVLGPIHQSIETLVDGQDLSAVVDDVENARRQRPRLHVDDAATNVLPETRVRSPTDRVVVELESLGAQQPVDFDELHQILHRVELAENRRHADAEVGGVFDASVRGITATGAGTSTEIDDANQISRTLTGRRHYGHGKWRRNDDTVVVVVVVAAAAAAVDVIAR